MANDIALLNQNDEEDELEANLSLDDLEKLLDDQVDQSFRDLDYLEEEKKSIDSPEKLGEVIGNVIWDQVITQIGVTAGEDFIAENRGLHLDLRKSAHIQTTENFNIDPQKAKIATHNEFIDYQKRYDDWQDNFKKDPELGYKTRNFRYNDTQQVWEKYDTRSDSWKKVLKNGARFDFDKGRPTGNNTANTSMDHIVSVGEIIRDPEANAHMSREEQIAFANSEKNLNLMDTAANESKGDSTMSEFLDSKRDGKTPTERFNINEEELRKKDAEARNEYKKRKENGVQYSIETGKLSQKREAFRISKKVARTIIVQLLADLLRSIIRKLITWFAKSERKLKELVEDIKSAVLSFILNIKERVLNISSAVISTIATAIIGPVVGTIRKAWIILKQGWASLKSAVNYLRDPTNKGKPIGYLMMETGKIVIAGLTGVSAIVLGDVIEKGLDTIPGFAFEIPLFGSLANIIGIFLGATVSGILGAIAINLIEKKISHKQKAEIVQRQIQVQNDLINLQLMQNNVSERVFHEHKEKAVETMHNRHAAAAELATESVKNIKKNLAFDDSLQKTMDEINRLLGEEGN